MDLMLLNADALNMVRTLDCMYTACVVSVASHWTVAREIQHTQIEEEIQHTQIEEPWKQD
jgi:hypothetical protein